MSGLQEFLDDMTKNSSIFSRRNKKEKFTEDLGSKIPGSDHERDVDFMGYQIPDNIERNIYVLRLIIIIFLITMMGLIFNFIL